MKILFDGRPLADSHSGGVKRVTQGLLDALKARGTDLAVVTTGTKKPGGSDEHRAWPNKIISILIFLRLVSYERLFKKKADLLFLPNIGWLGSPRIPYALVVHDLSFIIEPRWFGWKSRLWHRAIGARTQIKRAAILFAVSETTKNDLIRILDIPEERIRVIPLGSTSVSNPTPSDLRPNTPYLLALGGGDPRKNTSLSKTVADKTGMKLVLIGEAPYERVSDGVLADLYANAAAFLYPSWYEGFGLPLHEATYFHTPCIAATTGALPETAPEGTVFASPAKPQQWVEALQFIQKNPAQYQTQTKTKGWNQAAEIILANLKVQ